MPKTYFTLEGTLTTILLKNTHIAMSKEVLDSLSRTKGTTIKSFTQLTDPNVDCSLEPIC